MFPVVDQGARELVFFFVSEEQPPKGADMAMLRRILKAIVREYKWRQYEKQLKQKSPRLATGALLRR